MKLKSNHKKIATSIFVAFAIFFALLPFQNCGNQGFNSQTTVPSETTNSSSSTTISPAPAPTPPPAAGGQPQPMPPPSPNPAPMPGPMPAPAPNPAPMPGPQPAPDPTPTPTPAPNAINPLPEAEGAGRRFVFIAQGHMGRTVMSCDEGRTWIHDRSDNQNSRCWVDGNPNYVECDHTAGSARRIEYGNGWFYADFGWGVDNATLRKSRDGINWQTIRTARSGAGVSFYQNTLLWVNGSNWPISADGGATFTDTLQTIPNGYYLARRVARHKSLVIISSDDPGGLYSRDAGRTIRTATLNNVEWTRSVQIAEGNSTLLTLSSKFENNQTRLWVATTPDQGATWNGTTVSTLQGSYDAWSSLIFNGSEFVSWSIGKKWTSTNGLAWTSTNMNSTFVSGPVAISPNRVYVSIPNNWNGYYANQRAFYSTDGLNWTQAQFPGGHPILNIIGGYVDATVCTP